MRDLASRLRAIVQKNPQGRQLTYVPDMGAGVVDLDATASALGGGRYDIDGSACVVVDRVWAAGDWHGRRQVGSFVMDAAAPIALFDPRLASVAEWAGRAVFFDIETTGLSGGAGTIAFLAGCGWFDDQGAFTVRQFFLNGPAGEHALLAALTNIFEEASLLITFNGRSFDVPVMETRWAYHRREPPTSDLPHFDMLPPARRLWSRQDASCTLSSLERSILRFHRTDDVPGFEIPPRYFQFLRTGDTTVIEGVLEHNRHDLVSLAGITAHALRLAGDGPSACESPTEQLGLGRLYERMGDGEKAAQAYGLAAASEDREHSAPALARLAVMLRRDGRFNESAAAWEGVLAVSSGGRGPMTALERRATEALAIHHEHRARDLPAAKRYAETLRPQASGRVAAEIDHRLGRLGRKISAAKGGLLD